MCMVGAETAAAWGMSQMAANMAVTSIAASVVSTGLSAYGQMQQGEAAQDQANYQAKIMDRNAQIADMNAQDAERRGQIEEKQLRLRTANIVSDARSGLSGSGVVVDTGSPLDIQTDTVAWGEYDVQTQRWNVAKEVWGIKNQAANYTAQGGLYRTAGANAASAGLTGAGGSLLSGVGTVSDKWYKYNKEGAFT